MIFMSCCRDSLYRHDGVSGCFWGDLFLEGIPKVLQSSPKAGEPKSEQIWLVELFIYTVGEIIHFQVLSSKHIDMSTSSVYKFFEV